MTDQQKIDELNRIRGTWNGATPEGYIPLSLQALTSSYNEQHQADLLNGDQVLEWLGDHVDYALVS